MNPSEPTAVGHDVLPLHKRWAWLLPLEQVGVVRAFAELHDNVEQPHAIAALTCSVSAHWNICNAHR
jgi:hypothetical protein